MTLCFVLSVTMLNTTRILQWVLCASLSTCRACQHIVDWQSMPESPFVFRQPALCLTNYISSHILCRLFMLHVFSMLNFNSAWAWGFWLVFMWNFRHKICPGQNGEKDETTPRACLTEPSCNWGPPQDVSSTAQMPSNCTAAKKLGKFSFNFFVIRITQMVECEMILWFSDFSLLCPYCLASMQSCWSSRIQHTQRHK